MKTLRFLVMGFVTLIVFTSCTRVQFLNGITEVSHTERSGTILPELQLYEELVITRESVTISRNGMTPDTEVNEGTWEIEVGKNVLADFFTHLETIDCSSIRRVEPDQMDVGGGNITYNITYGGGDDEFFLEYGGGTYYENGEQLRDPIEAFIQGLPYPEGAAHRYQD